MIIKKFMVYKTIDIENEKSFFDYLKDIVKEGKIDEAVEKIATYLNQSTEDNYIKRLENIIETLLSIYGGHVVIRFLIENMIIDIPSLLENLSKKDSLLRYSFLLLLKSMCENECDLLLPYSEALLNSDDPNVREADLQLIIFMASGEKKIEEENLIKLIVSKLTDEKDFVVKKAIQALITIGKRSPSIIAKIISDYVKDNIDNDDLKKAGDLILKSIVSIDKIDEIVEEEDKKGVSELKDEDFAKPIEKITEKSLLEEEKLLIDKELELKKRELELKKKKLDLEEEVKNLDEKEIEQKRKELKEKEQSLEKEKILLEEIHLKENSTLEEKCEELGLDEEELLNKEMELIKKEMALKKKKLELEAKEKELEEREIKEKERALELKKKLLEKESELAVLSQVELELKEKTIDEIQKRIIDEEAKRVEERLKNLEEKEEENH